MYKIYFADLGKAVGNSNIGKRPVVSVGFVDANHVRVYKITSRNKQGYNHYVRMNNYIINGFCDVEKYYTIDTKYLLHYERDCTTSESKAIYNKTKHLMV